MWHNDLHASLPLSLPSSVSAISEHAPVWLTSTIRLCYLSLFANWIWVLLIVFSVLSAHSCAG